jgi:hypothetical protein
MLLASGIQSAVLVKPVDLNDDSHHIHVIQGGQKVSVDISLNG